MEREAFALVVGTQSAPVPQTNATTEAVSAEETHEEKITDVVADVTEVSKEQRDIIAEDGDTDSNFLDRLRQLVQEQMTDSDFGVESLASDMSLSRVQLYRKVKALTGRTPVDIIRLSRLNRAKVLLAQGSKNISEVAYDVGFSSPSYFTKCFKDEFGMLPGNVDNQS
jgi:AraC-like DNA-binding protein